MKYRTADEVIRALNSAQGEQSRFREIMEHTELTDDALQPYLFFSQRSYTRNLIEKTADFELMVLCWEAGQHTPVHDHDGSEGWMLVISGDITEKLLKKQSVNGFNQTQAALKETLCHAGQLSHINDTKGLHSVHNAGKGRAVSLHLYAPPISQCRYLCPEETELREKTLSFFSVRGQVIRSESRTESAQDQSRSRIPSEFTRTP